MKKVLLFMVFMVACWVATFAQTKTKDLSLGLHFGNKEYAGEYGSEFFGAESSNAAGAISLSKYLTPSIDGLFYLSYGRIGMPSPSFADSIGAFSTDILDLNITLKYKFANGKILKEDAKVAPFIFGGFADALTWNSSYENNRKVDFNFPIGIGADFRLNDVVSISIMSAYNYSVSDRYDALVIVEDFNKTDQWLFNTIGVKFNMPSQDPDKDGITSSADSCPELAGDMENMGCPEVKEEDKVVMANAMKGLLFETGSATIKSESITVLDAVYNVLNANKAYVLSIEGHTDNTGSDEINNKLSQDRADAAKAYLVDKGIDGTRIVATGFGSSKPVASNDTDQGRKQNRRVIFNLMY